MTCDSDLHTCQLACLNASKLLSESQFYPTLYEAPIKMHFGKFYPIWSYNYAYNPG